MTALCWRCGHRFDEVAHAGDRPFTPVEGDVSVCVGCAEVGVFTGGGLEVREPTPGERMTLFGDQGVIDAVATILMHLNDHPSQDR